MPERDGRRRRMKVDDDVCAPLVITANLTVKINGVDFVATSALTGGPRLS